MWGSSSTPFCSGCWLLPILCHPDHIVLCCAQSLSPLLCKPMNSSLPGSPVYGDSPGKNTRVGCHALLEGIFPTQGWNLGVLPCWWVLYFLSNKRSPRILEWVACPFSRWTSQPRNWTGVSCIGGRFLPTLPTCKFTKGKAGGRGSVTV